MNVTAELKKELAQWLDTYWTAYLKGDIETWANFIRDDYRNIGGTKEEIWNSKQEIIDYTTSIMDQMLGTVDIRNREIELIPYGEYMMVNEFTDLYVKIEDEWILYGPFRMSSLLEKTDTGWIALHQHGSYPDMKAMEGEAFSMDAVKAENAKLLEAVKSRTIELEQKNRELEIESSLERVRSVAMGMQNPAEMVDVCKIISEQLEFLKVKDIRNVQTAVIYESKGTYINYEYYARHNKKLTTEVSFKTHHLQEQFANQMLKGAGEFFSPSLEGQQVKDWYEYQKTTNQFADSFLEGAQTLNYYMFSLGPVALGISTYSPLKEEEINLFKRFRNVFELAYRRFIDIQKAEAQAREAQIELGLERVRARAMAMQNSNELANLVATLFKELIRLDFALTRCYIYIIDPDTLSLRAWTFNTEVDELPESYYIKYLDLPYYKALIKAWKERKQKFVYELGGEEKHEVDRVLFNETEYSRLPEAVKSGMMSVDRVFLSYSFNNFGGLQTGGLEPLSDENLDIFSRFGKVFDLTYTRFNDLKQAEAQAREALIEAAVERVRAKSMGMYQTSDLYKVNEEVLNQLYKLKVDGLTGVSIYLIDEYGIVTVWDLSSPGNMSNPNSYSIKYDAKKYPILGEWFEIWKSSNQDYFVLDFPKEKLLKAIEEFKEIHPEMANNFKNAIESGRLKHQWNPVGSLSDGVLSFDLMTPPSEDTKTIVLKMAGAFNMAYQRFLDLQKAEAQAREAQIETALERVRSRTMGMQKSEELKEVIQVVNEQFVHLNINVQHAGFIMDYKERDDMYIWLADPHEIPHLITIPYFDSPHWNSFIEARVKGSDFFANHLDFEEKNKFYRDLFKLFPVSDEANEYYLGCPGLAISTVLLENIGLYIENFAGTPYNIEENAILMRFGKVFQQTYTRFLDLQKAEAQAREAQIELALERVRAGAMAMRQSAELGRLIFVLYQELTKLDAQLDRCFLMIVNQENKGITWWMAGQEGLLAENGFFVQMNQHASHLMYLDYCKQRKKKWTYLFQGKEKRDWDRFGFSKTELTRLPEPVKAFMAAAKQVHLSGSSDQFGSLVTGSFEPLPDEQQEIISRFSIAFNQAYIRFLDLQKAEAQAREAQIEAALERVRSRTMAMQHSDELLDVASILFQQVKALGVPQWDCGFNIWNTGDSEFTYYPGSRDGKILPSPVKIPLMEHPVFRRFHESKMNGIDLLIYEKQGEEQTDHYNYMLSIPVIGDLLRGIVEAGYQFPTFQVDHVANFAYGNLIFITYQHFPEMHDVFKRFAKVFEQTYTRFLDLQKAEAQAREAHIEAALEKVRSRTMGMQHSGELKEAASLLFEQVQLLGVPAFSCGYNIWEKGEKECAAWMSDPNGGGMNPAFKIPLTEDLNFIRFYESKQKGEEFYVLEMRGERMQEHYRYLRHINPAFDETFRQMEKAGLSLPETQIHHLVNFDHGNVMFITLEHCPDAHDIFKRFGKVFEQTYRRFLDLQKAEAQAREAQIEASLERLRSKTMAMHSSQDVGESVATLFDELSTLGVLGKNDRCGIGIMHPDEKMEAWTAAKTDDGKAELTIGYLNMTLHPLLKAAYRGWTEKVEIHKYILDGEDKLNYYDAIRNQSNYKIKRDYFSEPLRIVHTDFYFNEGCLYVFSSNEFSDESSRVLIRYAGVFGQTYRRYLDLQKAEAQAKEAIKASSLDRVRGEIASMRTVDDLQRITPIIWHELLALGVPFIRCGVFIINESTSHIQVFLSAPDGKSLAAMDLPFNSSELTVNSVNHWRQGIIFKTHWNKQEFLDFMQSMIKEGQVQNRETYQGAAAPPESLHLHFVPFEQGMLYVGNSSPLEIDELQLVKSLAESFSIAYARYEDFRQLEEAKNQIEKTFSELKATQSQLIQAEKMASLGELTAGIAHEIQNPLNFVNNFSELSKELIGEMNDELAVGNWQLAKEIASDVEQNLEKINHHGKRAADIVKGMLQHSRTSSGQKELSDINALADEYLRLAYHGLRAKDKSFNADFKTEFDPTLPKINVIPQDIGRVLLNLINNAFYAVDKRAKESTPQPSRSESGTGSEGVIKNDQIKYEPTVTVTTSHSLSFGEGRGEVKIIVKDNGSGIPSEIKDKIFQPFFTTKPTGQGTGLGLSLSYDIVKVHGGELKVETKEGEGSEFIIQLPA